MGEGEGVGVGVGEGVVSEKAWKSELASELVVEKFQRLCRRF